jgi:hypothetical protein
MHADYRKKPQAEETLNVAKTVSEDKTGQPNTPDRVRHEGVDTTANIGHSSDTNDKSSAVTNAGINPSTSSSHVPTSSSPGSSASASYSTNYQPRSSISSAQETVSDDIQAFVDRIDMPIPNLAKRLTDAGLLSNVYLRRLANLPSQIIEKFLQESIGLTKFEALVVSVELSKLH